MTSEISLSVSMIKLVFHKCFFHLKQTSMEKEIENLPLWVYEGRLIIVIVKIIWEGCSFKDRDEISDLLDAVGNAVVHYPDHHHHHPCSPHPFGTKELISSVAGSVGRWQLSSESFSWIASHWKEQPCSRLQSLPVGTGRCGNIKVQSFLFWFETL